ncbi:MAG: hypothetical protein IPJ88_08745 [Myxococcales bacterium]|nr:MAG: hypothetical protein IPJ88_08745 [Myxococcales bacterium]
MSVDNSAEVVDKFRKAHPKIPNGVRIKEFGLLEGWFKSIGLDAGATIPIHVFANPQGKVRCVRTGAVDEPDYDIVKALIKAG